MALPYAPVPIYFAGQQLCLEIAAESLPLGLKAFALLGQRARFFF